ncbi:LysE/ArgO family amino acid transporter [Rummeliibacillus pycnus]|uniref:LysE/ArgO family amino acid transporter n=1 Tax=Rummeliibacillus pycnus TaxID=101070 RepID=UPI0037CBF7F3
MQAFLHGLILAFGLILPLGVQNIFVFSQGVTQPNVFKALPAAIAAALCDTLLIVLAVFGLSMIVLQFEWIRFILLIGGFFFLLYMGKVIWCSSTADMEDKSALPFKQQVLFALSVSLLNPHALLDTVGVIGTSALKYKGTEQILFAVACIGVSWIWFLGLMIVGAGMKKLHISGTVFDILNKLSALFIWGTAIYLFISLF